MPAQFSYTQRKSKIQYYGIGLLLCLITLAIKIRLAPLGTDSPFILVNIPIILSALIGGIGPGFFSTAVMSVGTLFFFKAPYFWLGYLNMPDTLQILVIIFQGIVVSLLSGTIKRTSEMYQSERQWFRSALSGVGDAVIATDRKGEILFINPIAQELTGWPFDKAVGKHVSEVMRMVYEKTNRIVEDPIKKILTNGRVSGLPNNTMLVSRENKRTPIDDSGAPVKDDYGNIIGAVLVFRDISERKMAELRIRNSEKRYRTLIEKSADALVLVSGKGKILFATPSIKKILGYTPQELKRKNPFDLVIKEEREMAKDTFRSLINQNNSSATISLRVKSKNGTYCWVESTSTNLLHDPNVHAIVVNFRDITAQKELEERKDEFISVASHELKTPLTSMKAFAQLLQKKFEKSNDRTALHYIERHNIQMSKLSNLVLELLDTTRINSGSMALNKEKFNISELVKDTISDVTETSQKHVILMKESEDLCIYADRERIGQVLMNLLSNAIKYSPDSNKVLVSVHKKEFGARVRIQDFGIGIPKDDQKKIFTRFYQVAKSKMQQDPSLGLGLYISDEIIKKHDGKLWVDSTEGKGSSFYFEVPLK